MAVVGGPAQRDGQATEESVDVQQLAADLMRAGRSQERSTHLPESVVLYLDYLEAAGRSPHTISAYRRVLSDFCASVNGGPPDSLAVRDFLDSFANHNSRLHALITLRQWYGFQISRGIRGDDPTAGIPIARFRRREYPPISQDEFTGLLSFLDIQMRVFATVLYWVGSRVTETCQMRVEHIYFDGEYGTIDFPQRKGGDAGFAAFGPEVSSVLRPWLVGRSGWVFPNQKRDGTVTRQIVASRLLQAGVLAEVIGRVTPHRFRHNFATEEADAGMNQLSLQKQLGHNDPKSTAWYFRPSRKGLIKAYRKARENPQG